MKIFRTLATALAALTLTASAFAGGEGWLDNYAKAIAQAKAEKKLLFIEFTGSDWCPPCKKQAAEVFEKEEFKEYAKKNLVLLELDFPRTKPISDELKTQNRELASKFSVRAYPTIVLLDAEEKEQTRFIGYGGGGAKTMVAKLKAFRE